MDIIVGKDYRVLEDSLNFILLKKTKSNPKHHFSKGIVEEKWKLEGYYGVVDSLVNVLTALNLEEITLLEQLSLNAKVLKEELILQLEPLLNDDFSVINVGMDYLIKQDTLNLILLKRKESDPNHHFSKGIPKESWNVVGYFGKGEHLVHSLIEKSIKDLNVNSIEQLSKQVKKLKDELTIKTSSDSVSEVEGIIN